LWSTLWLTETSPYPGPCSTDHYDKLLHRHGVARRRGRLPFTLREALSDNRLTESTAKPTTPAACPRSRPVAWSVTVDLHKATRNYRPCHSEQTRHGDKNWKHNHAIGRLLPRHPAESLAGSSLASLRRRGVVGNVRLRAYARDPQGCWHHYRCPSKACRAATCGLLMHVYVLSSLVATGILTHLSNHDYINSDCRCVRGTDSSRRSSLVRVCKHWQRI
jgi:hypothetical protein